MDCFLGCFGGANDRKRGRKRSNQVILKQQRKGTQNVQQQSIISAEQGTTKITPNNVVPELQDKPCGLSPSPRKRVTFDSNVKTYENVLVNESTDSLRGDNEAFKKEKEESSNTPSQLDSLNEDNTSVISSVSSYPPNHRYHNARDSDDEVGEEYGASDLDDLDNYHYEDGRDDYDLDLDDLDDYHDEDGRDEYNLDGQEVWTESVLKSSGESSTKENSPARPIKNEEDRLSKNSNARDRSLYVNSVLNPIENTSQWKAVKSKGTKPQKENFIKQDLDNQSKYRNQEIAVNASLSNWLVPSEASSAKKTSPNELETISLGSNSATSFEDRPILGALTVDELKQISASSTPRKSPNRSFDEMPIMGTVGTYWNHSDSSASSTPRKSSNRSFEEMPIIGTVGTYWNHSDSSKSPEPVSSCKGIPITSCK